jgi:hypothetical protein
MSDAIKRRILAAREHEVTAGGRSFTIRRMADLPLLRLRQKHGDDRTGFVIELTLASVVGWTMHEAALFPGGSDMPVPFDADLFATWVEDQPETFNALRDAVVEMQTRHREQREASEKN